jgi:thiamine biosynthesis lipoprotein
MTARQLIARSTVAIAALVFLPVALTGCATSSQPVTIHGAGLGADWSVRIAGTLPLDEALIRQGIQARIDDVGRHLSRWDPSSSLSLLNTTTESDWQPVAPGLLGPLRYALELAAETGGAFDPTVAPLVDAWGFGTSGRRYEPPAPEEIRAAQARVGHAKVALDASTGRLRKPAGMQIDLSSMTHGRAADEVAAYLDDLGVSSYLIDVGSELRAKGSPASAGGPDSRGAGERAPDRSAWRIAIERPPAETTDAAPAQAEVLRTVWLRDAGIATSGNYRYFFDYNGKRYSHRIDPRTGEPVTHDLASVTVIDPECMRADALATALTVLGPDEGLKYATDRNIAALFVLRAGDGTLVERMTPRFEHYLN